MNRAAAAAEVIPTAGMAANEARYSDIAAGRSAVPSAVLSARIAGPARSPGTTPGLRDIEVYTADIVTGRS